MTEAGVPLVDWTVLDSARARLGGAFIRIYGYFRDDAEAAVAAVEAAMRANSGPAMIDPAAALRSAAEQMGAEQLADLAEDIEMHVRSCVETMLAPDDYVDRVAALRPLLAETLAAMDAEVSPLIQKRGQFGRKPD